MVHEKGRFGSPDIHNLSYVDPLAVVIGRVTVEEQVIIAPHASIRADEGTPLFYWAWNECSGSSGVPWASRQAV